MDHIWKTIGFIGFEILDLCSSHPVPYHNYYEALEAEVPGALLGVAMLLVSVVCIVACVCCKERRNGFKTDKEEEVKEFRDSTTTLAFSNPLAATPGTANPASELSIFPPPGVTPVTFEPLPSLATLSPRARRPPGCHAAVAELDDWFADQNADFPRHQLQFLKDCGRGWFGRVVEGEARGPATRRRVMVRMLREDATAAEQRLFLGEVKPYRDLDHGNVLRLVGRCLETQPWLVLLEACPGGDLKSVLCSGSPETLDPAVRLSIMCQVADGLNHMISHGFVHTDLAARNCQVTSDLTVKVGDYGTSIDKYKDEYYIAGDVAVPIRWCAPESLHCTDTTIQTKQVTAEANVWSLGVLLWEVCQLGQLPYCDLSDDQVIVHVLGGATRLPPPTLPHSPTVYTLMCQCWGPPANRPPPSRVLQVLRLLRDGGEDDFQRRWDALKPGAGSTPEITLETMTARSDFDSGVDLEIKSTDREILDFVKKSSSDVNLTPGTSSPQLSVTSSSGGEFFSQTSLPVLKKQQSPSLTNLHGSVEDVSGTQQGDKTADSGELDSWLQGVETNCEEDVKFVKKISEAIRDLDDALAMEKTSSSSDDSRQESPDKTIIDFRLGPMSPSVAPRPVECGDDSLRRDSSGTDTEDEGWRGRVERGEFTEKVKEKSKSVTDLMVLTHIESESETDSLPSLTRQYSTEKKKKYSGVGVGFGSEGNIRGAVLGEEFQDALKQLQAEWKLRESESRETSLQFIKNEQSNTELDFLSNEASENPSKPSTKPSKPSTKPANPPSKPVENLPEHPVAIASANIVEANIINDSFQCAAPSRLKEPQVFEVEKVLSPEISEKSRTSQSPEVSESSQNTESSSETSTPTQYEVVTVRTFLDAEKALAARESEKPGAANKVPNVEVCPRNRTTCDSTCGIEDASKAKSESLNPSDCLVLVDNLLSNDGEEKEESVVSKTVYESESGVEVPLTVKDFLLLRDERESSTFVPEIVVTEASILDVESESENEMIMPNVTRGRKSIRLVLSSSDSESEDEKLQDVTVTGFPDVRTSGVVTSTPLVRRNVTTDGSVSEVDPTFTDTGSFFVPKPNSAETDRVSSVILGSCEDYTLDYFKGLKTTFGKQTSDESTDEFSKSEDEREDEKPTNWTMQNYGESGSDVELENGDLELNNKNREESAYDYSERDLDILNPKIKFEEFGNTDNNVMICDRMDIFEGLGGKQDQDQKMEEVKSRLEDVAKLSESFCLKNHNGVTEDDEDGKLLTPDDERSSDSGFRDKGSLSESVEDGCDEKYNLEDIEAELEQGEEYTEQRSEVAKPSEEGKDARQEERLDKLDCALDADIDQFFHPGSQGGWYLHPPSAGVAADNGWLPTEAEAGEGKEYRNLDINEEFVTAIRNELREKLPCAQNPERPENEEDVSPEEERTDLVIQYNTYPAPLSPIFEERESISSNQSSLLLDETGKSLESSGKSSPIIYVESVKVDDSRFEEDIKSALDVCSSESTESDNVLVTVEDLEDPCGGRERVQENPKEDAEDLLIVDMETNKVILYESPRPKSQLAFVKQVLESVENSPNNSETYTCYHSAEDNMLSVDRNNLTCTPDSCTLSPMSSGSSRTGAAVSFSSSETGGNLSGFYLSPSSVRSDLFDSGPPSLPFDLGLLETEIMGLMDTEVVNRVEEIRPNNEAEEIVQELIDAGVIEVESGSERVMETDLETEISSLETKESSFETEKESSLETEKESSFETKESSLETKESSLEKKESSLEMDNSSLETENHSSSGTPLKNVNDSTEPNDLGSVVNGRFNSNVLQICNVPKKNADCDKIDSLLNSEKIQLELPEELELNTGSQEWLRTVLLGNSQPETEENGALVALNPNNWPKAEELLPVIKCERITVASPESPSMDMLEVVAKFYDVNSTLAISTPNNVSFDESKDNSQLSSFTSTPTVENKMFTKEKVSENVVPSLSSLANEIVSRFPPSGERKEVPYEDSSPEDSSEREKRLQGMTLALEASAVSKAPMPSPEDADKGSWRPTMNQLMELTSRPEAEDMMTTSFIDNDNDNDGDNDTGVYTPDWESDSSDDSEDRSSSSGEFIWRDGDREEAVRVVIACDDLQPQDGASDRSMARISEGEEEEEEDDEDSSSCGSTTEFVPSTWDRNATPTKSALRSAEKLKGVKRNVSFKRQKYHCVYEYPREPGSEDEGGSIQQPCWQTPDYSTYTAPSGNVSWSDWEYGEGEAETDEEEEEDTEPRPLPESEYDFYRLSNLDFDMMTQMHLDEGEFYISSSARPFQSCNSSQFFPGGIGFGDDDFLVEFQPCAADTDAVMIPQGPGSLYDTVNTQLREVTPRSSEEKAKLKPEDLQLTADLSGESTPAEVSPTLGELRHTRERLKLDLGKADSGEDSGVGSSDKLDQVEESAGAVEKSVGEEKTGSSKTSESSGTLESSGKSEVSGKLESSDTLEYSRKLESSGKFEFERLQESLDEGRQLESSEKFELERVQESKNEGRQLESLEKIELERVQESPHEGRSLEASLKKIELEERVQGSTDKGGIEGKGLCSAKKLNGIEENESESVDKIDPVEGRYTETLDRTEIEEIKTGMDKLKTNPVEDIKARSTEGMDIIEHSLSRTLEKSEKDDESKLGYLSKLDNRRTDSGGEDSGVGSSDKLDHVEEVTAEA